MRLLQLAAFLSFVLLPGICPVIHAAESGPAKSTLHIPPGVKLVPNLEYANVDGKSLLLDLYLPEVIDKPVPVILYVHGGGWVGGDKRDELAIPFAARGYAVVSINYRFSQEAIYPAQIQDCKAAVRWIRAHARYYSLDSAHIGAWGTSAGGHLVALLGTSADIKELEGDEGNIDQSSRVQAVCDWFGPTDLTRIAEQADRRNGSSHSDANSPHSLVSRLVGGAIQENKDKAAKANPITYITRDTPPFLIMHGDKDPLVPLAQSEILRDALKQAGVEVDLQVIPGAGHGFGSPAIYQSVEAFFDRILKSKKTPSTTRPANG